MACVLVYIYVCNDNKFSMISKSWLTNFQKLSRFLVYSISVPVISLAEIGESISLIAINSARRRCNLLIRMCFAKKFAISHQCSDGDFTQGTKFARCYRNRLNFRRSPFRMSLYSLEMQSAGRLQTHPCIHVAVTYANEC